MSTSSMMKSWQTDTYLLDKQKGGCACGYKNEHQQYRSSFTNESVERMRKGKYEYLSFWWRNKSRLLHRHCMGRWSKLPRKQYRKDVQSAGKAVRHALLLWKSGLLPYVIDSHAWEIAKAKGAKSAAKEVLKAEHTTEKRKAFILRWAQDKGV